MGARRRSFTIARWVRQRHTCRKAEAKFGGGEVILPGVGGQCRQATKLRPQARLESRYEGW